MLKRPNKEYGVYHWDTFIGEFNEFREAERFVFKKYGSKSKGQEIRSGGADRVHIVHFVGEKMSVIAEFNVG